MGPSEVEEIRCVASGRVQGVMFRDFVTRKARKLLLTGYVRNNENGTVEVLAQGTHDNLAELVAHLHKGSLFSRVSHVDVEWRKPATKFDSFELRVL